MSLLLALLLVSCVLLTRLSMSSEPTPEMAALLAKFREAAAPAEPHAWLETLTGEWLLETSSPLQGGDVTKGTVRSRMIHDGRFLFEELESEWMGGTITRWQSIGYDNVQGKFVVSSMASNSTGIYYGSGVRDEATGDLTLRTPIHDPMSPEGRMSRTVVHYPNSDEQQIEVYDTRGDEEILVVEMKLRRKI